MGADIILLKLKGEGGGGGGCLFVSNKSKIG